MPFETARPRGGELARRFRALALVLLVLALAAAAAAALWPLDAVGRPAAAASADTPADAAETDRDTRALLAALAGRRLVRPPQIEPAVLADDRAAKLRDMLALRAVVSLGGQWVAYVAVRQGEREEAVQTVRVGDPLLAFRVERIEPGLVTLNLEGTLVQLGH